MKKTVLIVSLIVVAGVVGFFLARTMPTQTGTPAPTKPSPIAPTPGDKTPTPAKPDAQPEKPGPAAPVDKAEKEEYDRHYAQGLVHLADKRYQDALAEFQKAKDVSDTVEVAAEIEKLQGLLADEQRAAQLVREVEQLRQAGDLDRASAKAAEGVEKYWTTSSGRQLADLRRAIGAEIAQQTANKKALAERKYQQAQGYYKQGDLRNAYLVLDEAVKFTDSPKIIELHDDAKSRVDVYDASLAAGDAYMKNPDTYEDAIASLDTAQKAWDTQEVRQRLDEAREALAARRDRIAVVDFETKGNFDVPDAGGALAELLLPRFQSKFDLIERTQLKNLLQEQNLQMTDLLEPAADRLAKIKRLDYLVLGSVMRFGNVHVTARLVQVNSGLIDRTGKISVPNIQEVDTCLDDLAAQLTMTPEEYQAYQAAKVQPDEPQPAPAVGYLPVSQVTIIFEGVSRTDFDNVDEGYLLPEEPPTTWREEQFKQELYRDIMSLGMEFMSKGQYYEASRQFEMALRIYPDDRRAMSYLSRAYRLMDQAPPPAPERERIVVFDFMAFGDPGHPHAGREVADLLASYFRNDYDVIDRYQLFWYMKRWNVSLRGLMRSRQRLAWFGRAFGVRYFVMGYLVPTGSFDVVAKVVDTQTGMVTNRARMHVRDTDEMRLRMADFHRALFLPRNERRVWIERSERRYRVLSEGQACMRENKFAEGMRLFAELMNMLDPDRDRSYLSQARRHYDEAKRHVDRERRPEGIISVSTNLLRWARERKEAERQAEAARRKLEASYRAAMEEGNAAMAAADYATAMRSFAAAMSLRKTDAASDAYRKAKKLADEQRKLWEANRKAEKEYTAHMEAGRKERLLGRFDVAIREFEAALGIKATKEAHAALANAKQQFEEYKRKQEIDNAEKERQDRIDRAYTDFMAAAGRQLKKREYQMALGNYTQALAGLKKARQLLARQQARAEAERKQRERETAKPDKVPPKKPVPSPKDGKYARLMKEGGDLMAQGEYSRAAQAFGKAYGVEKTDEAKTSYREAINKLKGVRAAEQAKKAEAERQAREEKEEPAKPKPPSKTDQTYARFMADAKALMEKGDYSGAARLFSQAYRLKKTAESRTAYAEALNKAKETQAAEQGKRDAEAKARAEAERKRKAEEAARRKGIDDQYNEAMAKGLGYIKTKNYEKAVAEFTRAQGIKKTHQAMSWLSRARKAQQAEVDAAKKAEADRKAREAKAKEDAAKEAEANRKAREAKAKEHAAKEAKKAEEARKAKEEQGRKEAARRADREKAKAEATERTYQFYMKTGEMNMRRQRYRNAMANFANAMKAKMTKEAQAGYDEAKRKVLETRNVTDKPPKEKAAEAQRRKEELDRKKREAAEAAAQKAKVEKEYSAAIAAGKQYLKARDYTRAIEQFNRARGLKNTSQVNRLLKSTQKAQQAAARKPVRPSTRERPKPRPGKAPDPGMAQRVAAVQKRFENLAAAAGGVLQKKTYEEQAAEIERLKTELKAARKEWKAVREIDSVAGKTLRAAYSNAKKAIRAAEAQAKEANKNK